MADHPAPPRASDRPAASPTEVTGSEPELRRQLCGALQRLIEDGQLAGSMATSAGGTRDEQTTASASGQGRPLITVTDVEAAARAGTISLPVTPDTIVTAAACDRAAELDVALTSASTGATANEDTCRNGVDTLAEELASKLARGLSLAQIEQLARWCWSDGCSIDPGALQSIVQARADRVGIATCEPPLDDAIVPLIDHTLLKPEATEAQVTKLCQEALEYGFASVCINPYYVPLAADLLRSSAVRVCTVVGFPLGANMPDVKSAETRLAVDQGADEIDMVINVGALKSGREDWVVWDIRQVVESAHPGALVKVILETALLTDDEIVRGCEHARNAGAEFVKTSTGFGPGGATVEHVALMRRTVGRGMGVKAAGGIGSRQDAAAMIAAGATRLGASAGVRIAGGT